MLSFGNSFFISSLISCGDNNSKSLLYIFPSNVSSRAFFSNSFLLIDWKLASEPSLKTQSTLSTLSRVTPYLIEVVPDELLPTIPPIIQRLLVDVFGPKNSP